MLSVQNREEALAQVAEAKRRVAGELLILAHHYQRDEIVEVADFRGDSLELSRRAAATDVRYIVFCGVRFMAETAAILARPDQRVLLPREEAGCFLADQATVEQLEAVWKALGELVDLERELLPIAYINSSVEVKAFVGRHGGAVCTSANAEKVLRWAFSQRPRVLFLPDQYLGRNMARRLGLPEEEIALWDPRFPEQDLAPFRRRARLILWRGACNVHVRFLPEDVRRVRKGHPEVRVIVHPECRPEVVELSDEVGSTSFIIRRVSESPPGSCWAVGTEGRLVARLAKENPDKTVLSLSDPPAFCRTMSLTRLEDLARTLSGLLKGEELGRIEVPEEVAAPARAAISRMMGIS
ncbi:MAG: quinolinate synthase NadA [Candidatus Bipolaricaulia bacterium]